MFLGVTQKLASQVTTQSSYGVWKCDELLSSFRVKSISKTLCLECFWGNLPHNSFVFENVMKHCLLFSTDYRNATLRMFLVAIR